MRKQFILATVAIALALPLQAAEESDNPALSPSQIVEAAAPEEWVSIPADDLLVMTLAPDSKGNPREVIIQLMPAPFSQGWVHNIKLLARSGWYDGISVNRVQDNYVVQWGDPAADGEDAKPLPDGLKVMGESSYSSTVMAILSTVLEVSSEDEVGSLADAEYKDDPSPARNAELVQMLRIDPYAARTSFYNGISLGFEDGTLSSRVWPVHCYGMVGVARDLSPNTGDGSSLYTVIGHAPRHLDRNIALVGRVIEGMEHLSSLPRGKGELGFYAEDEADKRTPILSVKVASDIEQFPQPTFEYLSTESESFARYAEARANRRDPFFIHPAGGADICNIPVPVRAVAAE